MFSEKIKIALIKKNMNKTTLAEKINTSNQNLYDRMKRDNMTEKQMLEIAKALDGELIIIIKLNNGEEI